MADSPSSSSSDDGSDPLARVANSRLRPEFPLEARFQNDDAHLVPSRLWFASSAFPMVAGTLGPVASAFSICALVRQWRMHVPPMTDLNAAKFVPDPPWLLIINAVQLAVALVANLFLLLNMAKRVRFTIAQPITIVGWYISSILLIACLGAASGPLKHHLRPLNEYAWSQAFYYGIWAAILYFLVASLMLVTFWGAWSGHYDKDFNLTNSQRTLMLQTIAVLAYMLIGALVFSKIEDWPYLDAVYWADVTLFTIGFGDFAPKTQLGRGLLIPYALVGTISVGLVISSISSLMLERGSRRLDARMEEKRRRKVITSMTRKGDDHVLTPLPPAPPPDADDFRVDDPLGDEFDRRRCEFELMRDIQSAASAQRRWLAMGVSFGIWVVLWLVGAVIFYACELSYQHWTYFDAFYYCFISLLTIGYGDLHVVSSAGRSFFVFWSLLALPTMTVLISNAGDTVVKLINDYTNYLGNLTILPGDESFGRTMKRIVNSLSCGNLFKSVVNGRAPDRPRRPDRTNEKMATTTDHAYDDDAVDVQQMMMTTTTTTPPTTTTPAVSLSLSRQLTAVLGNSTNGVLIPQNTAERRSLTRVHEILGSLPKGNDFHLLLIAEIQRVAKHLREDEPRRYTFEEWAWYLGLIGEDERKPEMHRKAIPKEKRKHRRRHGHHPHKHKHARHHHHHQEEPRAADGEDDGVEEDDMLKWSWVGKYSPLVGGQEESEWILERLMMSLHESLWKTGLADEDDSSDSTATSQR
ncbi:hypothetical protein L249_8550 [Ophiocordyceps polyrhachis-furcata BCC 54312]|uniref:Potassium channel domain-containing protein n=1 Tax=Ophiocordyceps polyrhachis-furcata BCC 54312 TaxID=1330021 RepID=A0A367L7A2_9HYPO|nr:hypothetical protein L249_8550 [Ophiocordyceps polyrhachis-furcata BCC 54312]